MCDAKNTRFFRPWNVAKPTEEERVEVNSPQESQEDAEARVRLPVLTQEEDGRTFASASTYDDVSSASSSELDGTTMCPTKRRSRRGRDSSPELSSRTNSVNSDDGNESCSLDLLNNFVLGSTNTTTYPVPQIRPSTSTVPVPFPVVNGSPVIPPPFGVDYYHRFNFPQAVSTRLEPQCGGSSSTPVEALAIQASTIATTGQPFCYGFPAFNNFQQPLYAPAVEQAVEMLHRQDAAVKQMKKLRPKKFRCEHCDVAFSNNGQLKGHIRIHTGERPFKCDAEGCGKSFTRNEELTRHKRIHTGLRPHPCIICGKRFGRKDHLKKHMRTHENRDAYRMSAAALGMLALGHTLPQGHPFPPYVYPM